MDQTTKYVKSLIKTRREFAKNPQRPEPSWVRITTITMGSKFNMEIDIAKFYANFRALGTVRIRPAGGTGEGYEWTLSDAAFYNQVTIGYRDKYSGKSIKLFPNGSVHVAGASSLFDCKRILKQIAFVLKMVLELEAVPDVPDPEVWMINTNFSLNSSVNLNKLIQKLRPLQNHFKVVFEPSRYSAVLVKFVPGPGMKQVSASIFKTGKVIVTGAQKLEEIAEAYFIINDLIDPSMMVERVKTPETFDNFLGWTFGQWGAHLEKISN